MPIPDLQKQILASEEKLKCPWLDRTCDYLARLLQFYPPEQVFGTVMAFSLGVSYRFTHDATPDEWLTVKIATGAGFSPEKIRDYLSNLDQIPFNADSEEMAESQVSIWNVLAYALEPITPEKMVDNGETILSAASVELWGQIYEMPGAKMTLTELAHHLRRVENSREDLSQ